MKGLGVALGGLTKGGCMSNRCYLRGTSLLGLFNTVIGCLFNRVLVRELYYVDEYTISDDPPKYCWYFDKATNWPKQEPFIPVSTDDSDWELLAQDAAQGREMERWWINEMAKSMQIEITSKICAMAGELPPAVGGENE